MSASNNLYESDGSLRVTVVGGTAGTGSTGSAANQIEQDSLLLFDPVAEIYYERRLVYDENTGNPTIEYFLLADPLTPVVPADLTVLQPGSGLAAPSPDYLAAPTTTLTNVGDNVVLDTSGQDMGTVSHSIAVIANGFAPGETITIRAQASDSATGPWFAIGVNYEFIIEEGAVANIQGSASGLQFKRVVVVDNSSAAGSLEVRLTVTKGGAGGI